MRLPLALALSALVLAACGDAAPPAPTTAEEVAERVSQRFVDNFADLDGFAVRGGGAEASYIVNADSASLDWLQPEITPLGDTPPAPESALLYDQVPNARRLGRGLGGATFGGLVSRDGRQAYELRTDDPGVLLGEPGVAEPDSGQSREFRVYVDAETFDVLEIFQTVEIDSLDVPITSRVIFSDFRTVDGLTLPFSVRRAETGLNQMITDEDRMVAGGRLGLQRQQLEQMPGSPERDAALAQIEAEQRLLGDGVAEQSLTVDEVTVRRATE